MQRILRSSINTVFDESGTLNRCLADGWTVIMCNQLNEKTLEYVIEKPIDPAFNFEEAYE